jgi:hypothetical protein
MDGACTKQRRDEPRRILGKCRPKWKDNIKTDLRETGFDFLFFLSGLLKETTQRRRMGSRRARGERCPVAWLLQLSRYNGVPAITGKHCRRNKSYGTRVPCGTIIVCTIQLTIRNTRSSPGTWSRSSSTSQYNNNTSHRNPTSAHVIWE